MAPTRWLPRRKTRHEGKPPKLMAQYGKSGRRLVDECSGRRCPTATARDAGGIREGGHRKQAQAEAPSAELGTMTLSRTDARRKGRVSTRPFPHAAPSASYSTI